MRLATVVVVFLCVLRFLFATSAAQSPSFAQALLDEAWAAAVPTDSASLASAVREAELNVAQAAFLPTITASLNTDCSWSQGTLGGKNLGELSANKGNSASLSLRQNLFSGFTDVRKVANAKRSAAANENDVRASRQTLERRLLGTIMSLTAQKASLDLKKKDVIQAREVEAIAERKSQSGLLRPKDRLDSRRETFRVEADVATASEQLVFKIKQFNAQYRLKANAITVDALNSFAERIAAEYALVAPEDDENGLAETAFKISAGTQKLALEKISRETDVTNARVQRFSPSIDLSGSLGFSTIDPYTTVPLPAAQPDARKQAAVGLGASVALFQPVGWAQTHVQIARLSEVEAAHTLRKEAYSQRAMELLSQCRSLVRRLKDTAALNRITTDIRDKNRRLFDAGQLDVLRMIESQQSLSRTQEQEIGLANDLRRELLELEFFRKVGDLGEHVESSASSQSSSGIAGSGGVP